MAKAKVLAFINYKGGVAKTTSTYHVGCWLAAQGRKVLLVDIDPQTNLTFLCASTDDWQRRKMKVGTIASMYDRYLKKKPIQTATYIWHTPIRLPGGKRHPPLDLIPCDIDLLGEDLSSGHIVGNYQNFQMLQQHARQVVRERRFLATVVDEVDDRYDYILMDCPPNLYPMTQNALVASDWYVVTTIPDHLSTIGLNILVRKVTEIGRFVATASSMAGMKDGSVRMAELGAILFTRVRIGGSMLTTAHATKMAEIRSDPSFGAHKCFGTHTTELIGYTEAAENYLPVWLHDSENARRATRKQEYPKIVDELLGRF